MGTFSVFYDGQFWIGVAEREREGVFEVARVIFGPSEPGAQALVEWARDQFAQLRFLPVGGDGAREAETAPARNPKRRQREAARALHSTPMSTHSQAAIAAAYAVAAAERAQSARRRSEEQREQDWRLRQARKKKRRRGH